MSEAIEVAKAALQAMRTDRGDDVRFSSDEIWGYASEDVPKNEKGPIIKKLRREGIIEMTGAMRNAATPLRAGSKTPEYRFSVQRGAAVIDDFNSLCIKFETDCQDVIALSPNCVVRFASALLAKRFTVLTGLAGSGKTKLAQAFARWLTPDPGWVDDADRSKGKKVNPCYELVPVGADWTGNENILGYPNGLDPKSYIMKPALALVLSAVAKPEVPHFLILDEMNLSHVERYFADFLSLIESEEGLDLYCGSMENRGSWRDAGPSVKVPPRLNKLPENLFVIGTVNVDETTYMFSPKVLDRANVIEFRMDADELESFLCDPTRPDLSKLDGKGVRYGKDFVQSAAHTVDVPADVKAYFTGEMLQFFVILQAHGAEFGYRLAHEAARFMHFYKLLGKCPDGDTVWFSRAFDCIVFQKMLPKLHGSRAKLGPLLKKLWFLCVSDDTARGADALKAAEAAAKSTDKKNEPICEVPSGAPYPLSADKIARMWRLLNDNGFASFAEA